MRGIEGESETLGDWVSPIQWSDVKFGAHQEPVSTLGWRSVAHAVAARGTRRRALWAAKEY